MICEQYWEVALTTLEILLYIAGLKGVFLLSSWWEKRNLYRGKK